MIMASAIYLVTTTFRSFPLEPSYLCDFKQFTLELNTEVVQGIIHEGLLLFLTYKRYK